MRKVIAVVFLLVGCASVPDRSAWVGPRGQGAKAEDYYACLREARYYEQTSLGTNPRVDRAMLAACMEAWGYKRPE